MSNAAYLDVTDKAAISTDLLLTGLGVLGVLYLLAHAFFRKHRDPPPS